MANQPSAGPTAATPWPKLALVAGAACAALCGPFVVQRESGGQQHLSAYHGAADPAGVYTICDGDTLGVKPGDRETPQGCAVRVDQRLASFVPPVLKAAPRLYGHPYQLAASISLAYNIGAANFTSTLAPPCPQPKGKACSTSGIARKFNAGDWAGACAGFTMWNKANGKVVAGLVYRRTAEIQLCLKDLPK